jgi:tetratricopeptide (TPR) repeat protein
MRGRTNESVQAMKKALAQGHLSLPINRRYAGHLLAARRYEEAIKQADLAIAMETDTPSGQYGVRIGALCALGRYDKAIETERKYRLLKGDPAGQVEAEIRKLEAAFATEGAKGYWRIELGEAKKDDDNPYGLAGVYAQLGDTEAAITCLQTAVKERHVYLTWNVMTDWTLDPLRSDPRFHAILKEMHLE